MQDEFKELLIQIKEHLLKSKDSAWSTASVENLTKLINESINTIDNNLELNIKELKTAFLPTSDLQEILIENG